MAKKRNARPPSRKSAPVAAPAASSSPSASFVSRGRGGAVAALLLAAGFAGAALVYDSAAEASFDAPKRAVALLAVAGAALAVSAGARSRLARAFAGGPLTGWDDRRIPLALVLAAGASTIVSAFASPHRALSLDSLRATALLALVLPLGASPALARRLSWLVAALLGALGVDALVSILQARGLYQPFPLVTHGDREATGAFAGNVGYLALAIALGAVVAAGVALTRRRPAARWTAGALGVLFAASLLVNRNLTALSALAAGAAVLAIALAGRRAILPLAGAVLALGLAVALYAPMRSRIAEVRRAVAAGEWDTLVSYRTGAWLAAVRMARERPLVGFGPGTFPAEFVRHRLDAEIAVKRRLTTPLTTSSYGEAHNDYLQPFAEEGVPAALALLGAAALVVAATARRAARSAGAERTEAALLLGLLTAGATAALTWFPFQRPITALPLLFAFGRAWRLGAGDDDDGGGGEEASAPTFALPVVLALAVALGLLYRPEIARYGAERRLRSATDGLRFLLTHPAEVPDPPRALESIALLAGDAVPALPGDPRPLLVQGSARLVRGEAVRAIEAYRSALALGERAELDLNLGRAYERLGREEDARAAYLRAAWVSPALIPAMMPDVQGSVATEVARREAALMKGELKEPPPLPATSGPPGP